jgi:choline dehydrogenase-like flavoprotein
VILRAGEIASGETLHCDVCVVGAGAAGIVLARELAAKSLDVIVLESGEEEPDAEAQALNSGETLGAPQWPLGHSRLRQLGGTTNHWSGSCRPLDAIDFQGRDWIPASGWPIERATLEPYYARAHTLLQIGPYDYGAESWGDLAEPGPELRAAGIVSKLIRHGKPTRFGAHFRRDLAGPANLRVILGATVTQLETDASVRSIQRLEVRGLTGHRCFVVPRRTVLACGGIENARTLLLSNRIDPRGLGNSHDLVGRYFMDHPASKPLGALLFSHARWIRLADRRNGPGAIGQPGYSMADALQRERRLPNHALYMRPASSIREAVAFRFLGANVFDDRDAEIARFLRGLAGDHDAASVALVWLESEQIPSRDSRVVLGETLDALGQRQASAAWRPPVQNRDAFLDLARFYSHTFGVLGVGRMKLAPWLAPNGLEAGDGWWPHLFPGGWHQIGTTRMASSPEQGVVDSECRVFGLPDLYVAGSSVFPTSGYINPTLTIVALALRLADTLVAELSR